MLISASQILFLHINEILLNDRGYVSLVGFHFTLEWSGKKALVRESSCDHQALFQTTKCMAQNQQLPNLEEREEGVGGRERMMESRF